MNESGACRQLSGFALWARDGDRSSIYLTRMTCVLTEKVICQNKTQQFPSSVSSFKTYASASKQWDRRAASRNAARSRPSSDSFAPPQLHSRHPKNVRLPTEVAEAVPAAL